MVNLEKVEKDWQAIEMTPFPSGLRGKSVNGSNLTSLESEAGGLILTFVQTGGRFGARQLYYVREIRDQLNAALGELEGDGKAYFLRIRDLLEEIIAETPEPIER